VFVGDAWEADVVGPMSVGIAATWLSRGRETPPGVTPLAVVRELAGVIGVLEGSQEA
jgi:FMN phosphatase YigB (HAD superfamily)